MRAFGWIAALLGVLCLAAFGAAHAVLKELPDWVNAVGAAGIAAIVLGLFLERKNLAELGQDQTVGRSWTAAFATVLVFGIVVAANVLAHRYDDYVDFTEDKRFTLSQQSKDIVAKLDREIQVLGFFPRGAPEESNFRALMDTYGRDSTLLKPEYHDPYAEPRLAEEMKITSSTGTVILKSGENTQRLEYKFDEEAVTNAIVKVTAARQHKICVVSGHGEYAKDDQQTVEGLGYAVSKLEGQNYAVETLELVSQAPTPETCEVVLLPSPRTDPLPSELDRLAAYVAGGGRLLVMLDPTLAPATAADMARYGIQVGNDVVIEGDPNRQVQGGDATFIVLDESSYDPSPITEKLRGVSVMRLARTVSKGPDVAGIHVQELAFTTDQAWAESKLDDPTTPPSPDPGVDRVGRVPLVASAEITDPAAVRTTTAAPAAAPSTPSPVAAASPAAPAAPVAPKAGGKVVVFGDADFASNQMIANGVNQDLLLNTVAWMVDEKDQLSIRPNEAGKHKMTVDVVSGFLVGVVSLLVVPGLTIAGAVGTWLARRNK